MDTESKGPQTDRDQDDDSREEARRTWEESARFEIKSTRESDGSFSYGWSLIDRDGNVIAKTDDVAFGSRRAAEENVQFVKRIVPKAGLRPRDI